MAFKEKVRIFREYTMSGMEIVLNNWLEIHPNVKINHMSTSETPECLTVVIFYTTGNRDKEG